VLTHKPDSLTLDGNFKIWSNRESLLTLYANSKLEQSAKKRELPSKLHFRFHHEDNKIFSAGVESYDPFKASTPEIFSVSGLVGGNLPRNYKLFGGLYSGYHLQSKSLQYHKYLLALKHSNVNAFFEFGFNKVTKKLKNSEGVEVDTTSNEKSVNLRVNGTPLSGIKLGGDLGYNLDNKNLNTRVYAEYSIDSLTSLKAKIENDNTLTLGLTHNYKGLINFGFVSKFELIHPKEEKTEGSKCCNYSFKSKFGIFAELTE
jgi:hypothetical protein